MNPRSKLPNRQARYRARIRTQKGLRQLTLLAKDEAREALRLAAAANAKGEDIRAAMRRIGGSNEPAPVAGPAWSIGDLELWQQHQADHAAMTETGQRIHALKGWRSTFARFLLNR